MLKNYKIGQRYLYEGPDGAGNPCSMIYEIIALISKKIQSTETNDWQDKELLGIKLLQVKFGASFRSYEPYEEDEISDLINDKCSFTYLEGQDKPYV